MTPTIAAANAPSETAAPAEPAARGPIPCAFATESAFAKSIAPFAASTAPPAAPLVTAFVATAAIASLPLLSSIHWNTAFAWSKPSRIAFLISSACATMNLKPSSIIFAASVTHCPTFVPIVLA